MLQLVLGELTDNPGLSFSGLAFAWYISICARSSGPFWMEDAVQVSGVP